MLKNAFKKKLLEIYYYLPFERQKHYIARLFERSFFKSQSPTYDAMLDIQNYIKKYSIVDHESLKRKNDKVNTSELPIWVLWYQGIENAPDIVRKCSASIQKYSSSREVIFLDESNLYDYIELPQYIVKKKKQGTISLTHYSDIIRVCLLEKYGGTWIDATVLLTGGIPEDILQSSFFAYPNIKGSETYDFHLFCSWFIHAQPQHPLISSIKKSLFEYWRNESDIIDYFLFHYIAYNIVYSNPLLLKEWLDEVPKIPQQLPKILMKKRNDKFNLKDFNCIITDSNIHKLSYKYRIVGKNSFLHYLLNIYEI